MKIIYVIVAVTFLIISIQAISALDYSINVVSTPTPYHRGGGIPKDTDGDGIKDIDEMLAGTDRKDPCDPNPNCAACLATKPSPTPTETLKPVVVKEKRPPTPLRPDAIPPLEPKQEKGGLLVYILCGALITGGVVFLIYRLRKRALEEDEEIEEIFWE